MWKWFDKYNVIGTACALILLGAWFSEPTHLKRLPAQVNEQAALQYLDSRSGNWLTTSISSSHSGNSKCLSCHTTLSYTMIRPEYGDTPELQDIKKAIELRVKEFNLSGFRGAWYTQFEAGSISTETVINAISLVSMDLGKGPTLTPVTEMALKQMWQRQLRNGLSTGGFAWLDGYNLEPLESKNAGYWASSVIGSMLSDVPGYTERPDVVPHIKELKKYLANNFDEQNLHNKLMAIEANKKLGLNVIPKEKVDATLAKVLSLAEVGGGWDLHKLLGKPGIGAPDTYATAIVIKAFVSVDQGSNIKVTKGLKWLRGKQNIEVRVPHIPRDSCTSIIGAFIGSSPNRGGATSLFMTDLSTAFAIKALNMATKAGL